MFLLRLPFSILLIIYQSAFLALGQIWANKVRSMLTTVGIVIGMIYLLTRKPKGMSA